MMIDILRKSVRMEYLQGYLEEVIFTCSFFHESDPCLILFFIQILSSDMKDDQQDKTGPN